MKIKRVGFFRELSYGSQNDPSIYERLDKYPTDFFTILGYLKNAHPLIMSPEVEHDVISAEKIAIGGLNILTDGYWAWPQSLPYYFEHYKISLPTEFLEHIRSKNYILPLLSEDELANLELIDGL